MKYLIFLSLLLSLDLEAQKDFDYTFFTINYGQIKTNPPDTLNHLMLLRQVKKVASTITVSSITNSADSESYNVQYVGWDTERSVLLYTTQDSLTLLINPVIPVLWIQKNGMVRKYY